MGSVVSGKFTGASDIDVLVVTERTDLKYKMMVKVYSLVDAPVELHIVDRVQFREWYRRFIPSDELEKV